jgi:hypothetical protein
MPHQVDQISEQPLSMLIGRQLTLVEFVHDDLLLRFDGACLTAVTHPRVSVGSGWWEWGKPGDRDQVCERIGKEGGDQGGDQRRSRDLSKVR